MLQTELQNSSQNRRLMLDVANNAWSLDFTASDMSHNHARIWRRTGGIADEVGAHFQSIEDPPDDSALSG